MSQQKPGPRRLPARFLHNSSRYSVTRDTFAAAQEVLPARPVLVPLAQVRARAAQDWLVSHHSQPPEALCLLPAPRGACAAAVYAGHSNLNWLPPGTARPSVLLRLSPAAARDTSVKTPLAQYHLLHHSGLYSDSPAHRPGDNSA